MESNLAKTIILIFILILIFLNPSWGLFIIIGLTGSLLWSNRNTPFVKSLISFIGTVVVIILQGIVGIFLFIVILLIIVFLLNSCVNKGGPSYKSVLYKSQIEFNPSDNSFVIKDEIIIPDEERIDKRLPPLSEPPENLFEKRMTYIDKIMTAYSWNKAGVIDGKPRYSRQREQKASCSWFSAYTVNSISIPKISHDDLILIPNDQSKVTLDVPKYLIVNTFPSSTPQDLLRDQKEQFVISVPSSIETYPNLELAMANHILRNELGNSLLKTSIWTPVYWFVGILLLIFSKQIEVGIFIPFVKWLFNILGIKYKSEKEHIDVNENIEPVKPEKKSKSQHSGNKKSGKG